MNLHIPLVKLTLLRLNRFGIHQKDTLVWSYLSQVEKELFELAVLHFGYSNFTKEEWTAMRSLADDRSIIIKKADKGSCVVVFFFFLS